jgi:DNA-binding XRE family transcriptional regulator
MSKEIKKEENLVKKTCRELGITQKELAERIGVSTTTVMRWSTKKIDKTATILLEGLLYKKKFEDLKNIFTLSI